MLLFCFVVVIVPAWIFCLCFSQKQSANQVKKNYRGMLYYLIEKHMQKFRHFWRKKNFTWKSHLRPSCTKPFKCSWTILLSAYSSISRNSISDQPSFEMCVWLVFAVVLSLDIPVVNIQNTLCPILQIFRNTCTMLELLQYR